MTDQLAFQPRDRDETDADVYVYALRILGPCYRVGPWNGKLEWQKSKAKGVENQETCKRYNR